MSFQVKLVPGKGHGLVAVRDVLSGELVLQEAPLLSLPLDESGNLRGSWDPNSGEFRCFQLDRALTELTEEEARSFHALSDAFSSKGKKTHFGIVKTNSFSVSSSSNSKEEETRLVLFPRIARINHSCLPNCHHYWSSKKGLFLVRAVREIKAGEEVSISYMSPLQRRSILRTEFGFRCLCDACDGSEAEEYAEEDDFGRRRVLEIEEQWSELGTRLDTSAMDLAEEQFMLCEQMGFQAGLMAYVALHCVEAASLMVARSANRKRMEAEVFRDKTAHYAERALEFGRVAYGEESEECEIFKVVKSVADNTGDRKLLEEVQVAITALRDIDS